MGTTMYLGITLDTHLTYKDHITKTIKQQQWHQTHHHQESPNPKFLSYKTGISHIMLYANPIHMRFKTKLPE